LQAAREEKDHRWAMTEDSPIHPDDRPGFKGLDYFPPDPAYRFAGPIQVYPNPERFTILTTTGQPRPAERYGKVRFVFQGKTYTLQVYRLLDSEAPSPVQALFLPFTDKTSGIETYPAGRYVDFQPAGDGLYLLDFNLAHNPYCAYGMPEKYACPVTPPENHLPIRIEAGEKGYRHHGGGETASE